MTPQPEDAARTRSGRHRPTTGARMAAAATVRPPAAGPPPLPAGSVVLTRLYVGSGRSVLLVALWHTAFDLTSATTAAERLPAAITSTAVVAAAVVVLVHAGRRERAARPLRVADRGNRDLAASDVSRP